MYIIMMPRKGLGMIMIKSRLIEMINNASIDDMPAMVEVINIADDGKWLKHHVFNISDVQIKRGKLFIICDN